MKKMANKKMKLIFLAVFTLAVLPTFAQNSVIISGQDPSRRVITTAVPFLNFAPDSRHSGMGDAGVATTADANSAHWNPGKIAFYEEKMGFSISYSPWLGKLVNDMSLSYLSGIFKIDEVSGFAFDLRYFNMGDLQLTDGRGNSLGEFNPRDIALGGSYSRKLSKNLGLGISSRFIYSNLSGNISSVGGNDSKAGIGMGVDIGLYHQKEIVSFSKEATFSWGVNISNIGPKITYNSPENLDNIPTNLRLGTAYSVELNPMNKLTFALDFNKLLVPTPPIYSTNSDGTLATDSSNNLIIASGKNPNRSVISSVFGSLGDAPNGGAEEIQEIMISFGMEYLFNEKFAFRTGYFSENQNKGGRKYFTAGAGFDMKNIRADFSYLVPQSQNHPLAETLRFSLLYTIPYQ
jgi:hypothetical protein